MPTLNDENGLMPGLEPPDEVVHAFFRRFLPDFYFVNAPISRMKRHLEILRALPHQPIVVDFFRPTGAHFTELTLCAHDDEQPGLLSRVAGTLAALKVNVHTAWIHTLSDPHVAQSQRRVVLDTLILSESYFGRNRPLSAKTQVKVAATLTEILEGETTAHQMMRALRRPHGPIHVFDLSSSTTADGYTLIKLRAADDKGVLYRVTRALASLQLDVEHAQINTFEKSIDDVFFVHDLAGDALEESAALSVLERLREKLESDPKLEDFVL